MKKIIVVGATSSIAESTSKLFALDGDKLFLVGRDEAKLRQITIDLQSIGASYVNYHTLDLKDLDKHKDIFDKAIDEMDGFDHILIAHGTLPDQLKCEKSISDTLEEFNSNALSVISILTYASNFFEEKSNGVIIAISSVAGDRGRKSNYIYGSAKGAVSLFMQGLRARLTDKGVRVITVKPGFVDTKMTAEFKKNFLWTSPEKVAKGIKKATDSKRVDIIYLPKYWKYIMLIIKLIPEFVFKKLTL
jgi:short-subunit dehydrogenase